LTYALPTRGGYSQALIADNDVAVYINNTALILGTQFFVDPYDGSSDRTITLVNTPEPGDRILISVRTAAQYWIVGNNLTFRPSAGLAPQAGDLIGITSWNDTSEQNIDTLVFVGPETQGIQITEPYDSTNFDPLFIADTTTVPPNYDESLYDEAPYDLTSPFTIYSRSSATDAFTGGPDTFDYGTGQVIQVNRFDTGRVITRPDRLLVSLNGRFIFEDNGFIVDGSIVEILGAPINITSVVVITVLTESVVPGAIGFRIFQDMRGLQLDYRITEETTTTLAANVSSTADIIYVTDASKLGVPELEEGIFGFVTIDGERISYRNIDTVNNTISGLRRGTAGTGASSHTAGTAVYDIGLGNLLPTEYQNRVLFDNFLADGTETVFVAEDIVLEDIDSTELVEAVQVYVGGILQSSGYSITGSGPVTVEFDTAPTAGYQVSIRIIQGKSWYNPGLFTPSDGIPLQETNTLAARFIRGE
jgi:hypothetical protein